MAGAWDSHPQPGAWNTARPETERLFAEHVPSVPASAAGSQISQETPRAPVYFDESTLDESIWETIVRDVFTIGRNLRSVLIPVNWKFDQQDSALRNWDLWGPLIFILMLAITLSLGEKEPKNVFALVFTEVGLGAVILTINVILLGGDIVFFQSLCLLGYCLFPICIGAIICAVVNKWMWLRTLILLVALAWASMATLPFIGRSVPERRRGLAVYPVLLMYTSVGWLALVKK